MTLKKYYKEIKFWTQSENELYVKVILKLILKREDSYIQY